MNHIEIKEPARPIPSDELGTALCFQAGITRKAYSEELPRFEVKCVEWMETYSRATKLSEQAVRQRVIDQIAEARASLAPGYEPDEARSRSQHRESMIAQRTALKQAARQIAAEACEIARPIITDIWTRLAVHVSEMESAERGLAEQLGLTYMPSATIDCCRTWVETLPGRVPEPETLAWGNPRDLLKFIPE